MDDVEAGKAAFLSALAQLDGEVTAVIPSRATLDNFLISLSKGSNRVFITIAEDDLVDLAEDPDAVVDVFTRLRDAVAEIA